MTFQKMSKKNRRNDEEWGYEEKNPKQKNKKKSKQREKQRNDKRNWE